ncbi:MAG: CsgG/HfaB family protein [Smithellaceae bacterium]
MKRNNIRKIALVILGCLILGSASIAFAVEKPRIGVLRFSNNTQSYWWSASTASELQDLLINELAATKAFHVLERQELYLLLEQKFTEAILANAKTKLKTGKIRGIRYFIAATVSAFEENTNGSGNSINFSSRSFGEEQGKAYVVIDLKVIDRETGAIESRSIEATSAGIMSQNGRTGNISRFYGSLSKREKTPVGKAIRNCITEIAEYLECSLITKDEECVKKYAVAETRIKEKNKAVIQIED